MTESKTIKSVKNLVEKAMFNNIKVMDHYQVECELEDNVYMMRLLDTVTEEYTINVSVNLLISEVDINAGPNKLAKELSKLMSENKDWDYSDDRSFY